MSILNYPATSGINWNWINSIPSKEEAEKVLMEIEKQGLEHRGIYPPFGDESGFSIRFR